MLQYDWGVADEYCDISLLFASKKIELGQYGGSQSVKLKDIRVGETIARHEIQDGGCQECMSGEVYTFRMQEEAAGDNVHVRLIVKKWVECYCDGGELAKCEENSYVAHPFAEDSDSMEMDEEI